MNIFVVEDSQAIRRQLVRRLEKVTGARVIGEAQAEAQAVALIQWLQPDLVLLDLQLADGGSGLQVLTQLRRAGFASRVLVLTHQVEDAYRDACLAAGANGFYDKASGLDTLFDDLGSEMDAESSSGSVARASALLRDGLTGLFDATALQERLDQAAKMAQRDGVELAVYVVLLQGLADFSAARGVAESNALLQKIVLQLQQVCQPSDVLARHAPDQFSLVLTQVESTATAAAVAARLDTTLNQLLAEVGAAPALRAQIGLALFPGDAVAPHALLTLAEAHAYGTLLPQQSGSVFAASPSKGITHHA